MLLELDKIPRLYNLLAGFFTWLLLAGYLFLPGTFTSIRNSRVLADGKVGKVAGRALQNRSLLGIAATCCVLAALGMCWLGSMWPKNYVWLLNRIIL